MDFSKLGPKPPIENVNFKDEKSVLEYKEKSAAYNFALQTLSQMQTEEATMKANMMKSTHDAVMNMLNNCK